MNTTTRIAFVLLVTAGIFSGCSDQPRSSPEKPTQEETIMQNDYAERDKQTVRNFLLFLKERRIDDWIDLWAEDGVNVYPYHSGLFPERMEGKKAIFEGWKGVPDLFDSMDFPINEMWVDRESRTVIARTESHNVMRGGTGRYDNSYILVFKFNNQGKIKEYLEYFNPITTGVTYGLIKVEKIEKK